MLVSNMAIFVASDFSVASLAIKYSWNICFHSWHAWATSPLNDSLTGGLKSSIVDISHFWHHVEYVIVERNMMKMCVYSMADRHTSALYLVQHKVGT